ncbi:hypothetical protein J4Q44_G00009000 [Coregonus suidteri]|uniref:Uncharacterized protein n=1 Tax=Coregonus suidteri TaxID=861788 RepID=A0AAN8MN20_9TELE
MSFSFNFDVQLTTKGQQGEERQPQTGKQDYAVKPVPGNNTTTPAENVKAAVEHHPPAEPHSLLNDAVSETVTIGTLPPLHFLNESVFEQTAKQLTLPNALLNCQLEGEEEEEEKGRKGKKRGQQEEDDETIIEEDKTKKKEEAKSEEKKNEQKIEGEDGSPSPKRQALDPSQHSKLACCRFFSGDWTTFLALVLKEDLSPKYDIIFHLRDHLQHGILLSSSRHPPQTVGPGGVVYLATKAHYFGVGVVDTCTLP